MTDKYCCAQFAEARKFGTDPEGYGPAIGRFPTGYCIGGGLDTISFCPWCAALLPVVEATP